MNPRLNRQKLTAVKNEYFIQNTKDHQNFNISIKF